MSDLDQHARSGIQAIQEQRYDDAVASFQQALALEPDRPDMNNALGMAYLHRGEVGSALPHLQRAVELAAPYRDARYADMKIHFHTGLATAYQLSDRVGDAITLLRDTVAAYPEPVEPRLQLAQLLLVSGHLQEGLDLYRALGEGDALDEEGQLAARAVVGAAELFLGSDQEASVFLRAHRDSYVQYFDEIAGSQEGWFAEAARMSRQDGELKPVLAEGARPYALSRVDVVNPETGEVAQVYSDKEPMVVAVEGLEPLAQLAILFPWEAHPLDVRVSTQCPWHWLTVTIELEAALPPEARAEILDAVIGPWYLAGYNGDFGEKEKGRFHYVTDPEPVGDRAVAYTVDLGRARFEAIEALLEALVALHADHPVRRVLLGSGYLPE